MSVGQGYKKWLTPEEQEALAAASNVLIDAFFDEYHKINIWKPESILSTSLGRYFPRQYLLKYTPVFFKQFGICIIIVAWKFVQPEPLPLASVAEELAAWAIVEEAKRALKREGDNEEETAQTFQAFLKGYFKDPNLLFLFYLRDNGIDTDYTCHLTPQTSFAFENWFHPFSSGQAYISHPYAFSGESLCVGQAYKKQLILSEREALGVGIEVFIDEIFEDFAHVENRELEDLAVTTLGLHLPMRYLSKYTPRFLKQFAVCIITVMWKLAQPKRLKLSSIAEELAAYAIITVAQMQIELEQEEEGVGANNQKAEYVFDNFLEAFFEDTDFTLLFDDQYDGIETTVIGQMLRMTSLALEDWFRPFSDEPARIVHPYVIQ